MFLHGLLNVLLIAIEMVQTYRFNCDLQEFLLEMERALLESDANNPLNHSLEAVLPGIHSRMAMTQAEIMSASRKIDAVDSKLERMESLHQGLAETMKMMIHRFEAREMALADHLSGIADGIRGQGRNVRRKVAHEEAMEEEKDQEPTVLIRQPPGQELDDNGIPVIAKTHHIKYKHTSLCAVHNEWYGVDEYNNIPVEGGIKFLEERFKSKWRKHFVPSEEKAFSRLKRIINGMKKESERTGRDTYEIAVSWSKTYEVECKKSLSKMECWMKTQGIIATAAPRGKSTK